MRLWPGLALFRRARDGGDWTPHWARCSPFDAWCGCWLSWHHEAATGAPPHPTIPLESGWRRAQVAGSGGVRMGEGAAESFCGPRGWRDGRQTRFLEPRRAVLEDGHDGCAGVRGLRKPRKTRDLVGDPPTAAVPLPDGVHRVLPPICVEAAALPRLLALQHATSPRYQGLCEASGTPPTLRKVAGRPLESGSLTTQVPYRAGDGLTEKIEATLCAMQIVGFRPILRYRK